MTDERLTFPNMIIKYWFCTWHTDIKSENYSLCHEFLNIVCVQVGVVLLLLGRVVNWQELQHKKQTAVVLHHLESQVKVRRGEAHGAFHIPETTANCEVLICPVWKLHLWPRSPPKYTSTSPEPQQVKRLSFSLVVIVMSLCGEWSVLPQQSCWCRTVTLCATVPQPWKQKANLILTFM